MNSGLLLVDKPAGVTSHSVAARVLHAIADDFPDLRARKKRGGGPATMRFRTGHAGTLDPLATGLLLVLLGRGSRLTPFLVGLDKTYLATIRFGASTDTLDADGEVTATAPPPAAADDVRAVLDRFTGPILQVPPIYSALKRDGKTLHREARAGHEVAEPEPRPVTIHGLRVVAARWDLPQPELDLEVDCSSGTYVRSLARDLALAAGSLGHLGALRRTVVGPFDVANAFTGVMEARGADMVQAAIPLGRALPHLPQVTLDAAVAAAVRQGCQPDASWLVGVGEAPRAALLAPDGDLVAVAGRIEDDGWRLETVVPAPGGDPSCG
jgi:tRNA pseudouridine55 synthase